MKAKEKIIKGIRESQLKLKLAKNPYLIKLKLSFSKAYLLPPILEILIFNSIWTVLLFLISFFIPSSVYWIQHALSVNRFVAICIFISVFSLILDWIFRCPFPKWFKLVVHPIRKDVEKEFNEKIMVYLENNQDPEEVMKKIRPEYFPLNNKNNKTHRTNGIVLYWSFYKEFFKTKFILSFSKRKEAREALFEKYKSLIRSETINIYKD